MNIHTLNSYSTIRLRRFFTRLMMMEDEIEVKGVWLAEFEEILKIKISSLMFKGQTIKIYSI